MYTALKLVLPKLYDYHWQDLDYAEQQIARLTQGN